MIASLFLAAFLAMLIAGIPVAFALGAAGLSMLVAGGFSPLVAPQAFLSTLDEFTLLAIPLFLLMSNILLKGGVGRDLFAAAQAWVGHWPGGLAVAAIVSCGFFAAISGSSVATAATIGTVAIPEMIDRGYERRFVYGLMAAGGTLGILVPPSIPLIVYAFVADQSVSDLFLAGIAPGVVLITLFVAFSVVNAWFFGKYEPVAAAGWKQRAEATWRALPSGLLAIFVIGGIYSGAFTPTEASAIGFSLSLVITAGILRSLSWRKFLDAVFEAMVTSVAVLAIIAGARIFAHAIVLFRIPHDVSVWIALHVHQPGMLVLVVSMVLLAMGLVFETMSMIIIMPPVLLPSILNAGIDPVWFGIYLVIMMECALITPPVGMNLYVIQSVAHATLPEVARGIVPFLLIMLAFVFFLFGFPQLALFIPGKW